MAFVGAQGGEVYQGVEVDANGGLSTGVEENDLLVGEPFPNPSNSLLNIPIDAPGSYNIEFFDATGRMVLSQQVNNSGNLLVIQVDALEQGNYVMRVNSEVSKRIEIFR